MEQYILNRKQSKNEQNEDCMIAEIQFDKAVLRNGAKHCKHFFIEYKTEEELLTILSEFSFEIVNE